MAVDVEKLVRDYVAAWGTGDPKDLLSLITDDFVHEDMGEGIVFRGRAEIKGHLEETFAELPDFHGEVKRVFVGDGWAASEGMMKGTDTVELPSGEKAKKKFAVPTADIYELEGGKIKRHACYYDNATYLRQVGLLPEDS